MPPPKIALRQCCSSSDAYNPSVALYATFFAGSTSSSSNPSPRAGRQWNRYPRISAQWRQHASFSTTNTRSGASPRSNAEQDAGIRSGDAWANFEALNEAMRSKYANKHVEAVDAEPRVRRTNAAPGLSKPFIKRLLLPSQGPPSEGAPSEANNHERKQQRTAKPYQGKGSRPDDQIQIINLAPTLSMAHNDGGPVVISRSGRTKFNFKSMQRHMLKIAEQAWELSGTRRIDLSPQAAKKEVLDYKPVYVNTPMSPLQESMPEPWAVYPDRGEAIDAGELLNEEIAAFTRYMELSSAEAAARESIVAETFDALEDAFGQFYTGSNDIRMEVQGSQQTGLAAPFSDIDIRISRARGRNSSTEADPTRLSVAMEKVARILRQSFHNVEFRAAKFPIIVARHKKTGIVVQIVAANSAQPQQSATSKYLAEIPNLRSLYILFRAALGSRGLVDVYHGGTGAYGLLMMLVAALKRKSSNPPVTMADQYLHILKFYSELDTTKYGVSIEPPKLFKKHHPDQYPIKDLIDAARRRGDLVRAAQWAIGRTKPYQPYLLCLQDPADPLNDLGRKTNAIKHLQRTMAVMANTVRQDMQIITRHHEWGRRWNHSSILTTQLGPYHEVCFSAREKVERYGLEVLLRREKEGGDGELGRGAMKIIVGSGRRPVDGGAANAAVVDGVVAVVKDDVEAPVADAVRHQTPEWEAEASSLAASFDDAGTHEKESASVVEDEAPPAAVPTPIVGGDAAPGAAGPRKHVGFGQ